MGEMDASATADREILRIEIRVLELVGRQRLVIEVGIVYRRASRKRQCAPQVR